MEDPHTEDANTNIQKVLPAIMTELAQGNKPRGSHLRGVICVAMTDGNMRQMLDREDVVFVSRVAREGRNRTRPLIPMYFPLDCLEGVDGYNVLSRVGTKASTTPRHAVRRPEPKVAFD